MAEDFDELDGLPDDMGDAAEIDDDDASADDGIEVGFDGSDLVPTDTADESEQNAVEKEGPEDGEPQKAPEKEPWDKVRQQKDQELARLRKKIDELEGKTDTKPETETTPEADGSDFDTLFDKVEASETTTEDSPAGEPPVTLDDLDDYEQLEQTVKEQNKRLRQLEARSTRRESEDKLRASYAKHMKAHNLDASEAVALNKRVKAALVAQGFNQSNLPGEGQFDDIVGRAAAEMQVEALEDKPTARRKKAPPATPRPSTGPGSSARTPGSSANYMTTEEALAAADARRAAKK